ncbi:hypothetical protein LJR255_004689 [Pararhizobium sp. LjRoot255]
MATAAGLAEVVPDFLILGFATRFAALGLRLSQLTIPDG